MYISKMNKVCKNIFHVILSNLKYHECYALCTLNKNLYYMINDKYMVDKYSKIKKYVLDKISTEAKIRAKFFIYSEHMYGVEQEQEIGNYKNDNHHIEVTNDKIKLSYCASYMCRGNIGDHMKIMFGVKINALNETIISHYYHNNGIKLLEYQDLSLHRKKDNITTDIKIIDYVSCDTVEINMTIDMNMMIDKLYEKIKKKNNLLV